MRIIATPKSVIGLADGLIGRHVATVENEANGKRYAYVERWKAPWISPNETVAGWSVLDIDATGNIDFSELSDGLTEVEEAVKKAGLKS